MVDRAESLSRENTKEKNLSEANHCVSEDQKRDKNGEEETEANARTTEAEQHI